MKTVIITEEKIIDFGKKCLSNLRDFVNDEYFLSFNEVKRLRTLYFMSCQKVFCEQLKSKEKYIIKNINEVWNEKLDNKFWEAFKIIKKSKVVNDDSKVEEIFKTPVMEKYSRMKFSLEEINKILNFLKDGIDRCHDINEDLYYEIKYFYHLNYVYDINYI